MRPLQKIQLLGFIGLLLNLLLLAQVLVLPAPASLDRFLVSVSGSHG